MLTFSVFCGIIGIVHSDDPFELLFGYSILLQIRYYGYLFLKTLYCNFILQCARGNFLHTSSLFTITSYFERLARRNAPVGAVCRDKVCFARVAGLE